MILDSHTTIRGCISEVCYFIPFQKKRMKYNKNSEGSTLLEDTLYNAKNNFLRVENRSLFGRDSILEMYYALINSGKDTL